ncbi:Signal transduction histidine kinase [Rhodospirillales bacterium URHD0017]|nr:Signal transduction histidine kinase [Rhodospirillales bacterium URHD0017]
MARAGALAVGGSIWAAACFLFYVPGHIEYQLFLVTMLLGAVVSGLVTLAVYLPAYLAFVTPFVAATAIRYGLEGDPLHWGIALAAIVTFFLFINFARYIQRTFEESIRLRMTLAERNRELAERNREVERANLAKSRFLAVASHDLRQPLHALNLFAAQLRDQTDPADRARLVARIDAAIDSMNELFNALLDISKLDAGVLAPDVAEFPVGHLLDRIETTFAAAAREKGLRLRVLPSRAWVRTDAILLERILLNLVSNAIRYTSRGGVLVGCRRRGDSVRIEVWDSGIGLAEDQHRSIFGEFYQVDAPAPGGRAGLGLGLSIVDGLCRLLGHPIDLASRPGKGSRFAVSVPWGPARERPVEATVTLDAIANPARDKLVVVVDDDALVLDGMRGLLQGWGCRVVTADSSDAALAGLADHQEGPDLVISDYFLANGTTGVEVIERLRGAFGDAIPAFLISGDTTSERMREADARGLPLLHKPVSPMALRSMVNRLLRAAR